MIGQSVPVTVNPVYELQVSEFITNTEADWLGVDWQVNGQGGFTWAGETTQLSDTEFVVIVKVDAGEFDESTSKDNPLRAYFVALKITLSQDGVASWEFYPTGLLSPEITSGEDLYRYDAALSTELLQLMMAEDLTKP